MATWDIENSSLPAPEWEYYVQILCSDKAHARGKVAKIARFAYDRNRGWTEVDRIHRMRSGDSPPRRLIAGAEDSRYTRFDWKCPLCGVTAKARYEPTIVKVLNKLRHAGIQSIELAHLARIVSSN